VNVGCRILAPIDAVQGAAVPVRILYPTTAATRVEKFGLYEADIAIDAPVVGERRLLVAISHGTGSTPWAMRGLAAHLARAGFVVVLVEHPGNSRDDDSLAHTVVNLANRPRHVRLAIDAALGDPAIAPHVLHDRAAVIGHSLGGYTALAVAGGKPMALPNQTPDGVAHPIDVVSDPRVRAVVLLAPAVPWFMAPHALDDVSASVFVRVGERDELAPPYAVAQILNGVRMDYAVVPGAGHFAFFFPVPPHLATLPPGKDPPGFDRAAYQPTLYAEIVAFLERQIELGDLRQHHDDHAH